MTLNLVTVMSLMLFLRGGGWFMSLIDSWHIDLGKKEVCVMCYWLGHGKDLRLIIWFFKVVGWSVSQKIKIQHPTSAYYSVWQNDVNCIVKHYKSEQNTYISSKHVTLGYKINQFMADIRSHMYNQYNMSCDVMSHNISLTLNLAKYRLKY